MQCAAPDVQRMLLGNKCDLESKRVVVMEDGQRLADSQSIAFMETSAKSNVNISEAFTAMAQSILENKVRARGEGGEGRGGEVRRC